MNQWSPEKLSLTLSSYIDGALPEHERKELEAYLLTHPDAQRELAELKNLKHLVSSKPRLAPDAAFWTRLSVSLEKHREGEQNLLPFPRKFLPAVISVGLVAGLVVAVLTIQNRLPLLQFFNEKTSAVKQVYNEGILKGSILPLFSHIDKNQVLQFALFGVLPLDANAETALRVDEKAEKGYRIEVGRPVNDKLRRVTMDEFLTEVRPTAEQKGTIDSLLNYVRHRIEGSVLVGEIDVVSINADLAQLYRVMVARIAACRETPQRARFGKLLVSKDAPYMISTKRYVPAKPEKIFENIRRIPHEDHFVVVTPETLLYSQLNVDLGRIRREVEQNVNLQRDVQLKRDRILRRFARSEFAGIPRFTAKVQPGLRAEAPDFLSIEIENRWMPAVPDPEQLHVVVMPRMRRISVPQPRMEGYEFRVFSDSAGADGVPTVRFFRFGPRGEFNVDSGSAGFQGRVHVGIHQGGMRDSLVPGTRVREP